MVARKLKCTNFIRDSRLRDYLWLKKLLISLMYYTWGKLHYIIWYSLKVWMSNIICVNKYDFLNFIMGLRIQNKIWGKTLCRYPNMAHLSWKINKFNVSSDRRRMKGSGWSRLWGRGLCGGGGKSKEEAVGGEDEELLWRRGRERLAVLRFSRERGELVVRVVVDREDRWLPVVRFHFYFYFHLFYFTID